MQPTGVINKDRACKSGTNFSSLAKDRHTVIGKGLLLEELDRKGEGIQKDVIKKSTTYFGMEQMLAAELANGIAILVKSEADWAFVGRGDWGGIRNVVVGV